MEKNSEPSKTFTHKVKRFLTKVVRSCNGGKTVVPKAVLGELDIHLPSNEAQFSSITQSCPTLRPRGLQQARPSCSSTTPGVYSNSRRLSWWCHPTVSSSLDSFSSHLQPFPASGSFQMSQLFTSGGQCIGVSASASVLPPNIQNWLPLGWTCWISLQSKGLSNFFFNTRVQKCQFSSAQLSL